MGKVLDFPAGVFARWKVRFPDDPVPDPRLLVPCSLCGTTFAWRRYAGRCGWCYDGDAA